jgi:tetratricopeptide (TPR) repeat protein
MYKRFVSVCIFVAGYSTAISQTDSGLVYFHKGIEEKNARRFREAEKHFIKSTQFNNSDPRTLIELASVLNSQNRYAEARERLLLADKLKPNDTAVVAQLATLSFNLRKWDDAIRYANLSKQLKGTAPVSYIIGRSYYEQENYGEAIKHLNEAAKEQPDRADVPYIVARAYLDMSNYKESAKQFEKAIALDSSKANWIYECGLVYYAIPDYPKSLKFIELAGAKGYARSNDYLQNLGSAYLNTNQHEKGIEVLKQVLEKKPSDQELLYQVAQAYYKAKKYQEAIDHWDRVLGIDKTNARVLYMIGLSYQKKGEKQKGMQLCDKAIEMDPSLNSLRQKQGDIM